MIQDALERGLRGFEIDLWEDTSLDEARLDLFLESTRTSRLPAGHRLALLGQYLSDLWVAGSWAEIRRLHERARELGDEPALVAQSLGASAIRRLDAGLEEDEAIIETMVGDGAEALARAARLRPDSAGLVESRGYLYFKAARRLGREDWFSEARDCFRWALELDPGFQLARLFMGHILKGEGRHTEALTHFDRIEEEDLRAREPRWRWLDWRVCRALCRAHAGARPEAAALLGDTLDRIVEEDHDELLARGSIVEDMRRTAEVTGSEPLAARVRSLAELLEADG